MSSGSTKHPSNAVFPSSCFLNASQNAQCQFKVQVQNPSLHLVSSVFIIFLPRTHTFNTPHQLFKKLIFLNFQNVSEAKRDGREGLWLLRRDWLGNRFGGEGVGLDERRGPPSQSPLRIASVPDSRLIVSSVVNGKGGLFVNPPFVSSSSSFCHPSTSTNSLVILPKTFVNIFFVTTNGLFVLTMDLVIEGMTTLNGDLGVESLSKTGTSGKQKKNRIIYDKAFLFECIKHPASSKKPAGFPLPNLECTLATARSAKNPAGMGKPRKERDENTNKGREVADSISLRPQSASFASGCAANLNPSQLNPNSYGGRFQSSEEKLNAGPISGFYDREFPRTGSSRFANKKTNPESTDRGISEKEREKAKDSDREHHRDSDRQKEFLEKESDGRSHRKLFNQNQAWGAENDTEEHWGQRRKVPANGNSRYERDSRQNHHRDRNFRDRQEEDEPEWFSEGPTSRLDTIELRGFNDDSRNDNAKKKKPMQETPVPDSNGVALDSATLMKFISEEKVETERPAGSSRFLSMFEKNNSAQPTPSDKTESAAAPAAAKPHPNELYSLFASGSTGSSSQGKSDKPTKVQELEIALRSILLKATVPTADIKAQQKALEESGNSARRAAREEKETDRDKEAKQTVPRDTKKAESKLVGWPEGQAQQQPQPPNFMIPPSNAGYYYHPQHHMIGHPQMMGQVVGHPQQVMGHPQQVMGHPQQVMGHPQQVMGHPQGHHPQQIMGHQQPMHPGMVAGYPSHYPLRNMCYPPPPYGMPPHPQMIPATSFSQHQMQYAAQIRMGAYQQQVLQRPQEYQRTAAPVTSSQMMPNMFMPTVVMRNMTGTGMTAEQYIRQIIPTDAGSEQSPTPKTSGATPQNGN